MGGTVNKIVVNTNACYVMILIDFDGISKGSKLTKNQISEGVTGRIL